MFYTFCGSSRAFSSLHSKPCLFSPVNVTPLFNSQRWGGHFSLTAFSAYTTLSTLFDWLWMWAASAGLAMCVRGMQNGLLPQCGEQFSFILREKLFARGWHFRPVCYFLFISLTNVSIKTLASLCFKTGADWLAQYDLKSGLEFAVAG